MKYRKLRIAFSAGCGVVCLLLIALWVRSYVLLDHFIVPLHGRSTTEIYSERGTMLCFYFQVSDYRWHYDAARLPTDAPRPVLKSRKLPGFAWTRTSPIEAVVIIPFWFPLVTMASLAAATWIRWSRRFSLRTLLIATTLVAVVLGLISYASR
jgi:hypothetical protein